MKNYQNKKYRTPDRKTEEEKDKVDFKQKKYARTWKEQRSLRKENSNIELTEGQKKEELPDLISSSDEKTLSEEANEEEDQLKGYGINNLSNQNLQKRKMNSTGQPSPGDTGAARKDWRKFVTVDPPASLSFMLYPEDTRPLSWLSLINKSD